ncbi:MAG: methyltransferase domain-containing protein [Candidatus Peribacteria bacterium]|nr:MAG: methyltransferase domain-containing protein [Candidatus Peribacteria bacterium]
MQQDNFLCEQVTTMMVIEHDGLGGVIADRDSTRHTLRGDGTTQEILHIDGKSFAFSLSPQSFFQTNTRGCELLYSTVANILQESQATTLYDLYCGTGTIGQIIGSLVPSVQKVIGIDIVPEAIDDARANAERLGVAFQTEYHAGPVEAIFPTLTVDQASTIIVDPPRAGLHQ